MWKYLPSGHNMSSLSFILDFKEEFFNLLHLEFLPLCKLCFWIQGLVLWLSLMSEISKLLNRLFEDCHFENFSDIKQQILLNVLHLIASVYAALLPHNCVSCLIINYQSVFAVIKSEYLDDFFQIPSSKVESEYFMFFSLHEIMQMFFPIFYRMLQEKYSISFYTS